MKTDVDVLIIGAGPSGSISAALLARRGYRVRVLERQKFPRFSIGESLLANSIGFVEEAGMLEAVLRHGFQFKNGAAFARDGRYAEYNFADKSSEGPAFTFQVQRAEFDKVLADEAARQGADLRYEVEITAADFSAEAPRVTSRAGSGEEITHTARFVLDASGFGRTLPRLLQLERPSNFPVRAALFTHIEDCTVAGSFDRQKIRVGIHPQHQDVWSWLIPFANGRSSLGVVATREFHDRFKGSTEERLWQIVREDPQLGQLLVDARVVNPVGEIVGYAANVTQLHGRGFALLGNAAEFLDPVFSSGVTIAMQSASLAARILDRQFTGAAVDWRAEFDEPLKYGVETFRAFVSGWYDGSLQDIIFARNQEPKVRRMICSVLAGYAWDADNPFTGPQAGRRLRALAQVCRDAH